jgi:hypothetical protein
MEIKETNPAAAQSNVWVCGHSLAGIAGSNPAGGMDVCLLRNVVCFQVVVSATSRSLFQRSPTECVCGRARVCVCVSMSVIRRINNPLHLQCVDRSQTKRERNETKDEIMKTFKTPGRADECTGLRSF